MGNQARVTLRQALRWRDHYTVERLVNTTTPSIGKTLDRADVERLIRDGVNVTIKGEK